MSTPEPDATLRIEFDGADYWRRWADRDRERPEIPDGFVALLEALAESWASGDWQTWEGQLRATDLDDLEHARGRFVRMYLDWNGLDAPDVMLGGINTLVQQIERRIEELKDQDT